MNIFNKEMVSFTFMFLSFFSIIGQQTKIDSLKHLIKTDKKDSELIMHYYELSETYFNIPDSTLNYINRGLNLSRNLKLIKKEHQGLNLLSMYWFNRGNSEKSLEIINLALNFVNKADDLENIKTFDNYGLILHSLSRHDEAAEAHLKALKISEENEDSYSMVVSLSNLGNIYYYLGQQNKALDYHNRALEICLKNGYKNYIANCYGNLGLVYRATNQPDKALQAYKRAIELYRDMNEKFDLAIGLMNLGVFYEYLDDFKNAKKNYIESYKISQEIKDEIGVVLTLNNLAVIEAKTKDYRKALVLLDSSLVVAQRINYKEGYKHIYFAYSETYYKIGNYKEAYKNRAFFEQWKDSVSNERYLNKITELETKYETEKKEKEISILSEQQLKNEILINQQRNQMKWLGVIGIVAAILAFLIFLVYKQRGANKKQLELINAIEDTQTAERKRIAQDLHDSVGGSLALLKNKIQTVVENQDNPSKELLSTIQTVEKTSNDVRQIAHNLMPSELIKFGLVSAIQSILDQLNSDELKAQLYAHNMEQRIDTVKEVHLFRITQEVIQNVLKHAKAKNLTVYLNKYAKHLSLMVEDDGDGFVENTNEGLGIGGIKQRVEQLKGSLNIDSSSGRGTTFNIQIPV